MSVYVSGAGGESGLLRRPPLVSPPLPAALLRKDREMAEHAPSGAGKTAPDGGQELLAEQLVEEGGVGR